MTNQATTHNSGQSIDDILVEADAVLNRSNKAIVQSENYLKQLEEYLTQIEAKNNQLQVALDADITKIVEEIDDATIKFIKDTE